MKSYKFKLFRQLRCRESVSGHFDTFEDCVHSVKHPGCKGGEREKKTFEFELPFLEPDISQDMQEGGAVGRTSKAVSFKDKRSGTKKLFTADEEEEQP